MNCDKDPKEIKKIKQTWKERAWARETTVWRDARKTDMKGGRFGEGKRARAQDWKWARSCCLYTPSCTVSLATLELSALQTEPLFMPYRFIPQTCVCDAWVMRKAPMQTTPLPLSVWILLSVWEWTHTFLHQYASVCVSNAVALLWVPPSSSLLASVLSTPQSVDRHILYPLLLECSCFALAYLWPPWMQLRKSCLSLEGKSSLEAFGGNCFMLKTIGFALCVSLG